MVSNYFKINQSAIRLSIKELWLECYESLVLVMATDINFMNEINDTKYYQGRRHQIWSGPVEPNLQ